MTNHSSHVPVLLDEVIKYMQPADGEIYIDGTFGAGGYSRSLLEAADCKVLAIDRDPTVQVFAEMLQHDFPGRIELMLGCFGDMDNLLAQRGVDKVNGIVLDVGVSSMQLDQPERGFSFMHDGPLDMRMADSGRDAKWLVNDAAEEELADIIYQYGGERKSRRVARAIVAARAKEPITSTVQLANIIRSVVRASKDKIDPATRTFQALRIWINDELGELSRALEAAQKSLLPGGRLVVVSFHSLEDALVKQFFNEKSGKANAVSRHMPAPEIDARPIIFEPMHRKAIAPGDDEVSTNIRARSAKLRAAVRTNQECVI